MSVNHKPSPPSARKEPKTIVQLGRERVDPYAWLKASLHAIVANHKQNRINELLPWNFVPKV